MQSPKKVTCSTSLNTGSDRGTFVSVLQLNRFLEQEAARSLCPLPSLFQLVCWTRTNPRSAFQSGSLHTPPPASPHTAKRATSLRPFAGWCTPSFLSPSWSPAPAPPTSGGITCFTADSLLHPVPLLTHNAPAATHRWRLHSACCLQSANTCNSHPGRRPLPPPFSSAASFL